MNSKFIILIYNIPWMTLGLDILVARIVYTEHIKHSKMYPSAMRRNECGRCNMLSVVGILVENASKLRELLLHKDYRRDVHR